MEIVFSPQATEDLEYWKKSGNKIIQKRIQALLASIQETPLPASANQRRLSIPIQASGADGLTMNTGYCIK